MNETDLQHLDQMVYCPMIFQEYIPKAYELRIAYVAGEFFAGKIPSTADYPIGETIAEKLITAVDQ